MGSNLAKKIFEERELVSREQLDIALKDADGMNADTAQRIMQSAFEQDAFAGFERHQLNTASMEKLDASIRTRLMNPQNGDSSFTYFMSSWILFLLGIVVASFLLNEKTNVAPVFEKSSYQENQLEEQSIPMVQASAIDPITTEERFIFKKEKLSSAKNSENQVPTNENRESSFDIPQKMDVQTTIQLNTRNKAGGIKKPMIKEVALSDFVFVDYRGIRSEKKSNSELLHGTRANQGSASNTKDVLDLEASFSKISYHDFLIETASFLSKKNWSESQKRFELILKHYPNDLNAQFYLAYTLYNRSNYERSLEYFEQCTKAYYGNFDEEANWYKLKCYVAMQRFDKAKEQGLAIIEASGFYAEQAAKLLLEL